MADTRYRWSDYAAVFGPAKTTTVADKPVALVPNGGRLAAPTWSLMIERKREAVIEAETLEAAVAQAEEALQQYELAQQQEQQA
ncbi:MAG TPA: hypothetical protein VN719_09585 [Gemmatimonadales bacterium]|nr:hypothetical protein [Gemmatimonadales bacterium]